VKIINEFYYKNSNDIFDISPQNALIDETINIKLRKLWHNQEITLRAQMRGYLGIASQWESYAVFSTEESGEIDVGKQEPLRGTYNGIDPMGLFWSMNLVKGLKMAKPPHTLSEANLENETSVSLTAEVDGKLIAETVVKRLYVLPGIKMIPVTYDGLVGKFFYSPHSDPQPGIIVLSGSEGGIEVAQRYAGLLASHGYSVLALAYFKMDGLPENLYNIPLEYFEKAINWMQNQENVVRDRIGIFGRSKGGELALLLGATFPQISAIVAHTPSAVVFEGIIQRRKGKSGAKQSSWSYQGQPFPYVKFKMGSPFKMLSLLFKLAVHNLQPAHIYVESMKDAVSVEKATIQVEKINAPLLLISAEDDVVWPSATFCRMIVNRLKKFNFPYTLKHLNYSRTGHNIIFPYLPTTDLQRNGGNAKDNALASQDSWIEILKFFNQSLNSRDLS
jgi:hypothetical protein